MIDPNYRSNTQHYVSRETRNPSIEKITTVALLALGAFASLVILPPAPGIVVATSLLTLAVVIYNCVDDDDCISEEYRPPRRNRGMFFDFPTYEINLGRGGPQNRYEKEPTPIVRRNDLEARTHRQATDTPSGSHVGGSGWSFGGRTSEFSGINTELTTRQPERKEEPRPIATRNDPEARAHRQATDKFPGSHVGESGWNFGEQPRGELPGINAVLTTRQSERKEEPRPIATRNDSEARAHRQATDTPSGSHVEGSGWSFWEDGHGYQY